MSLSLRIAFVVSLAAVGCFAAVRILRLNVTDNTRAGNVQQTLHWYPAQGEALLRRAEQQLALGQLQLAASSARDLLERAPLEGRAYRLLADIADRENRETDALALYSIAAHRAPRDLPTRAWLTQYYLEHGQYDSAMEQVDQLLRYAPARGATVLPLLAKLSADPDFAKALGRMLRNQPPWRGGMLATLRAAGNEEAAEQVQAALLRNGSLSDEELAQWLATLLEHGHWGEAYARWAGTLATRRSPIPTVYNGSLDHIPTGMGFDWRVSRVPGVSLEFVPGAGDNSRLIARAVFRGRPVAAVGMEQPVLLPPGDYSFSVRQRADALRAERGLEWTLTCAGQGQPIAVSERAEGSFAWRTMVTAFQVPTTNCPGLWLRLRNSAPAGSMQPISGSLWFDDVRIAPVPMTAAYPESRKVAPAHPSGPASGSLARAKRSRISMTSSDVTLAVSALATAVATPTFAQDRVIWLQVDRGTVMTSDGGDFATASTGKLLAYGQRIVVTDGAVARVVYVDPDGDNRCVMEFGSPNVYVVDATCHRVAAMTPDNGMAVGNILSSTAVAAAILANMDEVPPSEMPRAKPVGR